MTIRYSTNWMGPISLNWYRDRGLTTKKTVVLDRDSVVLGRKAGETYEIEEIITRYSCGRIDILGTDNPHGDEINVPPMLDEDWHRFRDWLETFETDDVWTLDQLVELYERHHAKINWFAYSKTLSNPSERSGA